MASSAFAMRIWAVIAKLPDFSRQRSSIPPTSSSTATVAVTAKLNRKTRERGTDVEGQNDVAAVFRSTAEGETGHAHGHLDYLATVGDPVTDLPIGASRHNLKSAIAGETHEYTDMYPGMAKAARGEGFEEIADWFETLAKAERSHANRFQKALDALTD